MSAPAPRQPERTAAVENAPGIPNLPDGYLTEDQVAGLLGVSVMTLRTWAVRRKGPPRTVIGRRPIYREAALLEWIAAQEETFDRKAARRRA